MRPEAPSENEARERSSCACAQSLIEDSRHYLQQNDIFLLASVAQSLSARFPHNLLVVLQSLKSFHRHFRCDQYKVFASRIGIDYSSL